MEDTATLLGNRVPKNGSTVASAFLAPANQGFQGKSFSNAQLFSSDAGHVSKLTGCIGGKGSFFLLISKTTGISDLALKLRHQPAFELMS